MIGTIAARMPKKPNRLSSFWKAPMALKPVLRPMAISATISVNPNVTANMM